MSKLEELLQGVDVKWLPLGDYAIYEQPTKYLVKSKDYNNEYNTPVLTAGKTFVLGYTNENDGIYKASLTPVIIFDDFTTANKWVDFDFKAKSSAMKIIKSKDESKILLRYIYYWINSLPSDLTEGDHKRQWISNFSKKLIPIPCPDNPEKSLEIQQEIVRVLDELTSLTNQLKTELETERQNRKKQFEFFREQLFRFEEGKELEWKTLGDIIISLKTGLNPRKNFVLNAENSLGFYVTVREIVNEEIIFGPKTDRVSLDALKLINNRSNLEKGDVLFSGTGTVGRMAVIKEEPYNWNIKEGVYVIKPKLNILISKYLLYVLSTQLIIDSYRKKIVGSPVVSLPMKDLRNLKIPVPSFQEQERIVHLLDQFDEATKNIVAQLEKEIELRNKQYEYYREKLLSFPQN